MKIVYFVISAPSFDNNNNHKSHTVFQAEKTSPDVLVKSGFCQVQVEWKCVCCTQLKRLFLPFKHRLQFLPFQVSFPAGNLVTLKRSVTSTQINHFYANTTIIVIFHEVKEICRSTEVLPVRLEWAPSFDGNGTLSEGDGRSVQRDERLLQETLRRQASFLHSSCHQRVAT